MMNYAFPHERRPSRTRLLIALAILGMGIAHVAAIATLEFPPGRFMMDFIGTGIAVILVGLLNLYALSGPLNRVQRLYLLTANGLHTAFLGMFVFSMYASPVGEIVPVFMALVLALVQYVLVLVNPAED